MVDGTQIPTATTQDERTIALLAHLLQIVLWWIAPLIILVIKRNSRFISFHALQALLLQGVYLLVLLAGLTLGFGALAFAALMSPPAQHATHPEFVFFMPILVVAWMSMGLLVLLAGIIYGVKAGRGEWAEYPVLGRWCLRLLKLGPGGIPR